MAEYPEPDVAALAVRVLADCKIRFEQGDYSRLIYAFKYATMVGVPLPQWLADEALVALQFNRRKGGASGRGKKGGHLKQELRAAMHRERYRVVAREMDRKRTVGGTDEDAYERASIALAKTPARGSATAMKDSYEDMKDIFEPKANSRN